VLFKNLVDIDAIWKMSVDVLREGEGEGEREREREREAGGWRFLRITRSNHNTAQEESTIHLSSRMISLLD
jgi:hypothetical protein